MAEVGAKKTAKLFSSHPQAGFPSPGDDLVEKSLDLNDLLIDQPSSTFFVRVSGDSMEGSRIFDEDILIVDRSKEAKAGTIVIAAVYGEMVVKRLEKLNGQMALVSTNEEYKPILVNDSEDIYIWGVVTGLVRNI
ncbi:translesion error-prone DNA polymerase V autoproteolytic subunit [Candidatus Kaiserbacteria bacterium]|nr:translesion error-prone DNA polymerase V autoproteolytic subunit [Candidatus Kaiserbacteria bacterium]